MKMNLVRLRVLPTSLKIFCIRFLSPMFVKHFVRHPLSQGEKYWRGGPGRKHMPSPRCLPHADTYPAAVVLWGKLTNSHNCPPSTSLHVFHKDIWEVPGEVTDTVHVYHVCPICQLRRRVKSRSWASWQALGPVTQCPAQCPVHGRDRSSIWRNNPLHLWMKETGPGQCEH